MTRRTQITTSLLDELTQVSRDSRMQPVLGVEANNLSHITFWVLRTRDAVSERERRLLYGWIVPSTGSGDNHWRVRNSTKWETLEPGVTYRIAAVTITTSASVLQTLLHALCEGEDLRAAGQKAMLEALPEEVPGFRLGLDAQDVRRRFVVGPVVVLDTAGVVEQRAIAYRGPRSPSSELPAWSVSLALVNKSSLWVKDATAGGALPEQLVRRCLDVLKHETGLAFRGADAGRLGNIEALSFPSGNQFLRPLVRMQCRPGHTDATGHEYYSLTLADGVARNGESLLFRCRIDSNEGALLDQVQQVICDGASITVNFDEVPAFGVALLQVWRRTGDDGSWGLWFADDYIPMRSMELSMGIIGLSGTIRSPWLDKLKGTRVEPRAEELERIRQVHYEPMKVGHEPNAVAAAGRDARKFASALFPAPSGGGFFPKGWEGEGRLSFAEWFLALTGDVASSMFVLVDPYFDEAGVELFARAKNTQLTYKVLTNTQKRTDDESTKSAEGGVGASKEPPRAKRIRDACVQVGAVLRGFPFTVCDLRSDGGGSRQLFHDRYLLILKDSGEPQRGFHLSNSIQGLTKKSPLLVTPIPADLLASVSDYAFGLLSAAPEVVTDAHIELLFDSRKVSSAAATPAVTDLVRPFLALLLDDKGIASEHEDSLLARLTALHMGRLDRFDVSPELLGHVEAFKDRLWRLASEDFGTVWSAFAEWAARCHRSGEVLSLISADALEVVPRLERYIMASVGAGMSVADASWGASLMHLFRRPFLDVLAAADSLLSHPPRPYGGTYKSWGVHYAIALLAEVAPARLAAVASDLWQRVPTEAESNDLHPAIQNAAPALIAILGAFIERLETGPSPSLFEALLAAKIPILRALGAMSLASAGQAPVLKGQRETAFGLLAGLDTVERRHVLAEWIGDMRVEASRKGEEASPLEALRRATMSELAMHWTSDLESSEVRALVRRLSGPLEGSWSMTTTTDLLDLLVNEGKLTRRGVLDLWCGIMFERLDSLVGRGRDGADSRHFFYYSTDGTLTETCAKLIAVAPADERSSVLEPIAKISSNAERQLRNPLARSIDYDAWACTRDAAIWLQAFYGLLALHVRAAGDADEADRARKEYDRLENLLMPIVERAAAGREDVLTFRETVASAVASRE